MPGNVDRRTFVGGVIAAAGASVAGTAAPPSQPARGAVQWQSFRGVVISPTRSNRAGVLLQPTIAAIDPYMHRVGAELASMGYTVVIWDPYRGAPAPAGTPAQLALSKRIADVDAMRDLRIAVDRMTGPLRLRSIATIGWCLGGRFALLQGGLDPRLAAVVAYNPTIYSPVPVALYGIPTSKADFPGQTMDEFAAAARIACPVQIARPEHDLAQPAEYARLEQALHGRPAATQSLYFPGAAHGFTYKQDVPANRAAARLAWPATLALLEATRAS